MSGKFFEMTSPPPRRQHFRVEIFRCAFPFEKCPSKPGPNFKMLPTPLCTFQF
jgi:hypothetical protein